jgi:asparagine synthase (glutamine-hydrolysing)
MVPDRGPAEVPGRVADANPYAELLDLVFDRVMARWHQGTEPLVLLFSGGVDSSLIAWELRTRPRFALFTVGARGSPDLLAAEEGAHLLKLPWSPVVVSAREVDDAARTVDLEREGLSPVRRSVLTAFTTAVAAAPAGTLLCGQGADELFLGYAHYRGLPGPEAGARAAQDLERLVADDWPCSQHIARRLGRSAEAPYLDPKFVSAATSIPVERKLPDPEPKAFFRTWAEHRGLPGSLARRPKRALQYGSGIDRILRRRR